MSGNKDKDDDNLLRAVVASAEMWGHHSPWGMSQMSFPGSRIRGKTWSQVTSARNYCDTLAGMVQMAIVELG